MAGAQFKDLLRQARLDKAQRTGEDVKPAQVAKALGLTRAAYSHWEKGRSKPKDMGTARRLAVYLGVPITGLGLDIDALAIGPQTGPQAVASIKKEAKRTFTTEKPTKRRRKGSE